MVDFDLLRYEEERIRRAYDLGDKSTVSLQKAADITGIDRRTLETDRTFPIVKGDPRKRLQRNFMKVNITAMVKWTLEVR